MGFLLWTVYNSSQRVSWYEHLINPHNEEALLLLELAARQTHVKVLVFDSLGNRVVDWFEFANNFCLGEFADRLCELRADQTPGDFVAAQADFQREHDIEELLQSEPGS